MKATEQLKEEHRAIEVMLNILEEVSRKLEAGENVAPEHLDRILEFIRVFADGCHHGKEEDVLFPAMEEMGVPRNSGPIGVMLTEHVLGRSYIAGMSAAIGGYKEGRRDASSRIVENARNYATLLPQHIFKEENILYQIADSLLSEERQEELLEEFEKIEQDRIGAGKHEEFHKLLHDLSGIYLESV